MNVEWFDCEPSEAQLEEYLVDDKQARANKLGYFNNNDPGANLKKSEISLAYKHVKIYEDIIANNYSTALVLEDDVLLARDFVNLCNTFLAVTPSDWDMIFPGSGCDLRVEQHRIVQGQVAYRKDHPASKCTDSYFLTLNTAKKLISTIKPFNLPIDWELNYQLLHHDMNVYWWEPPVVQQGSQIGVYSCAIKDYA